MTPDEAIAIARKPISVDYFDWNAAGRVLADEVERLQGALQAEIDRNLRAYDKCLAAMAILQGNFRPARSCPPVLKGESGPNQGVA